MIKFGIRKNLLYPMMSIIFNISRKIETIAMDKLFGFNGSLLLTLIMFLAEIISGIILFLIEKFILFKKREKKLKFMGINLIQAPVEIKPHDGNLKIFLLILIIALIDFFEFIVDTIYIPQYTEISKSLFTRLRMILTLFTGILSSFILKLSMYKHQKFSLLIIFICLITVIIFEYFYKRKANDFFIALILIFIYYFFDSFFDITEKHVLEYDFLNPFKLMFIEGIFGFILTCFYTIIEDPFDGIKKIYNEKRDKFLLFILFLIIYLFLCAGRNIYRIITNKLFFPITRSLTDSILDPLLIGYYFLFENDFYLKDKDIQSNSYFIINLIISIIYVFFACIYNEVFVLFCCNLEHDTYIIIKERATIIEKNESEDEDDENENEHNEN